MDTLTVTLPEDGWKYLRTHQSTSWQTVLPLDFDQPRLLVEAMQCLVTTQPKLAILPGDDVPLIRDRYLFCHALLDRLNHYIDLCVMYGECFLRHENAQLSRERDEILRKEMHEEILMSRISSNMDKLWAN